MCEDDCRRLESYRRAIHAKRDVVDDTAWLAAHCNLDLRQLKALANLNRASVAYDRVTKRLAGAGALDPHDDDFAEAYGDYEKALKRAHRSGLESHPLVRMWIDGQRSVGARETLRDLRGGEEQGVRRMTRVDFWLSVEARPLVDAGWSAARVLRRLRRLVNDPGYQPGRWFEGLNRQSPDIQSEFDEIRPLLQKRLACTERNLRAWLHRLGIMPAK